MNSAIVAKEQVPTDKGAATFEAFEGAFFGVCDGMLARRVGRCAETRLSRNQRASHCGDQLMHGSMADKVAIDLDTYEIVHVCFGARFG